MNIDSPKDICKKFTAALFVIAPKWKCLLFTRNEKDKVKLWYRPTYARWNYTKKRNEL